MKTKFEQLLEKFNAGDQSVAEQIGKLLNDNLTDMEYTIVRQFYGLGCEKRSEAEIAETIGLDVEDIKAMIRKTLYKLG